MAFEYVVASHDKKILEDNFLKSVQYMGADSIIHIVMGKTNVPRAYNSIQTKEGNIVVFAHHDVVLPSGFEDSVMLSIAKCGEDWSVLGVAGVRLVDGKKVNYGYMNDRGREWRFNYDHLPAEVETLDEVLIITNGGPSEFNQFDPEFPLDFYAADLCMRARNEDRKVFAIKAYIYHNSGRAIGGRTESFYESQDKFRNKWNDFLPVITTTALVNEFE